MVVGRVSESPNPDDHWRVTQEFFKWSRSFIKWGTRAYGSILRNIISGFILPQAFY